MAVDGITPISFGGLSPKAAIEPKKELTGSFGDMLTDALSDVNELAINADGAIAKYAAGEITDLHEVMIAIEKSSVAMQYTLQIRNKLLDAYQEVMRMQV